MAGKTIQGRPIDGVVVHPLTPHHDGRGNLIEIYRENWDLGCRPVQFNAVTSEPEVLRGVHVHVRHTDHLFIAAGSMTLGLHDIRPWSPTAGLSWQLDLSPAAPHAVVIPPGVAHGFYFPVPSLLLYGASHCWAPADEICCRWDCEELGLTWPTCAPILSGRDAAAPSYAVFVDAFLQGWRDAQGTPPVRGAR